ncbi:hypothetical protein ACF0H5_006366 [Mactra antiquata]
MLKYILAIAVIVGVSEAQIPHFGKCPDIPVVQNLDVSRYLGDWYEISRFFFFIEGSEVCVRANYSLKDDGHIKVFNRGIKNGQEDSAIGDAVAEDSNVPAKLSVSFNGSPRVPYWIVDTDYDNYSLVWSCNELLGVAQADFSWILSRKKTLDQASYDKLTAKLASYGVDTSSFSMTDQSSCPY